jgi:hypothetical protein
MRWSCARGCGFAGEKEYATPAEAHRFAAAFDREDIEDLGRRAPLSMIALRLGRRGRDR